MDQRMNLGRFTYSERNTLKFADQQSMRICAFKSLDACQVLVFQYLMQMADDATWLRHWSKGGSGDGLEPG
jgi:hypothetical protein